MLLFYCAAKADLNALDRDALRAAGGDGLSLWTALEAALDACKRRVLVVEAAGVPGLVVGPPRKPGRPAARAAQIPRAAVRNLHPYRQPKPVVAAGGYVVRRGAGGPEVLLIFRRGVWDLPKGKRDPGETIDACALREVREEVGISTLHLGPAVGTTVHGYEGRRRYLVKTTHWFLMHTPETRFTPEAREGIEAVAWVPWREAMERIGYATLREHMEHIEETVRQETQGG